jgi:hypothetical protein
LKDFITAASHDEGKALNGLDFGRPAPDAAPPPFATDFVAYVQAHKRVLCTEQYPSETMRWGLCATAGAYHRSHTDCEGFGTFVSPECGIKLWYVGLPKPGGCYDDFANIDLFLGAYDPSKVNAQLFDWLPLILKPGMTL